MKKQITGIILALCITLTLLPAAARPLSASAPAGQTGMLYFNADDGIMRLIDDWDDFDGWGSWYDREYQKAESGTHYSGAYEWNGGALTAKGYTSAFYANNDFIGTPGSHVKFPSSGYAVRHSTDIDYEPSGIFTYSGNYNYSADDKYVSVVSMERGVGGLSADESEITRAEFTFNAVKALGLPLDGGTAFSDVPADAWYAGAVGTAYESGLVSGIGGGRFDPDREITRQEVMVIIYNMAKIAGFDGKTGSIASFADAAGVSEWALEAAQWNAGSGILPKSGGKLNPAGNITRGESAAMLVEFLRAAGINKSAFLSGGYELKAFDTPHAYKTGCLLDISKTTVGQITLSNLRIIESDETHEAKEGWEWRIVNILCEFNDDNYLEYGALAGNFETDYYSFDLNQFTRPSSDPILVNYYGEEILIELKIEMLQNGAVEAAYLVPAGYDGLMLAFFNSANYIGLHHGADRSVMLSKLIDEDTLFFRLDGSYMLEDLERSHTVDAILEDYPSVRTELLFYDFGSLGDYSITSVFLKNRTYLDFSYENAYWVENEGVYFKKADGSYGMFAFLGDGCFEAYYMPYIDGEEQLYRRTDTEEIFSVSEENGVRKIVTLTDSADDIYLTNWGFDGILETIYETDAESGLMLRVTVYLLNGGERRLLFEENFIYGEDDGFMPEFVTLCKDMTDTRTVRFITPEQEIFTFAVPKGAYIIPATIEAYEYYLDEMFTVPYDEEETQDDAPDELTIYMKRAN